MFNENRSERKTVYLSMQSSQFWPSSKTGISDPWQHTHALWGLAYREFAFRDKLQLRSANAIGLQSVTNGVGPLPCRCLTPTPVASFTVTKAAKKGEHHISRFCTVLPDVQACESSPSGRARGGHATILLAKRRSVQT